MCGIAGITYFDSFRRVSRHELEEMTSTIRHRGPDDEGFYTNNNIGLGFRRLSIIDLKGGHQPMHDSSGKFVIVFNGEIYNYKELKHELIAKGYTFLNNSDTEVIINLYKEYGERCVNYLRGMFAFVIWDSVKSMLFGARDRFGIKPFFYSLSSEKFIFGSEIKAIRKKCDKTPDLDIKAVDSYFTYGYIRGENTIYDSIKRLPPASTIQVHPFKGGEIKIQKYWDFSHQANNSISAEEWCSRIIDSLSESVKMRLISDVSLGAFLSGGIDSSAIVALMSKLSSEPVKTFSIGFEEDEFNELQFARQVANKYQTDHHEMIIRPESASLIPKLVDSFDEPFADSSSLPTYYVSKFAKEFVTVALSGDGGDELFAGYEVFKKILHFKNNPLNIPFLNKYFFRPINTLLPDYFFGKGYTYYMSRPSEIQGALNCLWKDYERKLLYHPEIFKKTHKEPAEEEYFQLLENLNDKGLSQIQSLYIKTYLVGDILTKVDRMSMLNSLEVRVPILDHKFAELCFTIPSDLKLKAGEGKYIFKQALSGLLPKEVLNHKKQGFSLPIKVWFKDDLKSYMFDSLNKPGLRLYDFVNPSKVNKILDYHQKGIRDYSSKLWSLLIFNEWLSQN